MNGKITAFKADGSIDEEETIRAIEGLKAAQLWFSYFTKPEVALAAKISGSSLEKSYNAGAFLSEKGLIKLAEERKVV